MKLNLNLKTGTIFTMVMAVMLSITACSNNNGKVNDATKTEETVPETAQVPAAVENGTVDHDLSFLDGNKKVIALNDLKGKVVFINFWATWCPPCIHEMPSINSLKKRYNGNQDIVFLMVDVDGNYEGSKKFMDKHGYDLPVHVPNGDIPPSFLGNSIPTTVILDKTGKMVARMEGGRDYVAPDLLAAVDELVASK